MSIFDDLGERLSGILPGMVGSPLGAAASQLAGVGQSAIALPPGMPTGQGALPPAPPGDPTATPAALPPNTAPGNAPPDLSTLYSNLLDKDRQRRNTDQGMTLIAAGLANPANRDSLIQMASHAQDQEGTATNQLNGLIALQQNSIKNAQLKSTIANAPAIAAKYGLDVATVTSLINTGKLGDTLEKLSVPDNQVVKQADGRSQIVNVRTGQAVTEPFGTQEVKYEKNAAGQIVPLVAGAPIASPMGPTNADDDAHRLPDKSRIIGDINTNPQKYGLDPNSPTFATDKQAQINQVLRGGGVTVNNAAENAEQHGLGAARADIRATAMKAGAPAQAQINSLDEMSDALARGGNNIMTGPFAQYALKAKEAINGVYGFNPEGLAPAETANKLTFALAKNAAQAITSRPTQSEFGKAFENVPGISQSPEGAKALIDINRQEAVAQRDLSIMAQDPANDKKNWGSVVQQYYADHPIMSPFDHTKVMGKDDVVRITTPGLLPSQGELQTLTGNATDPNAIYHYNQKFGKGSAERVLGVN